MGYFRELPNFVEFNFLNVGIIEASLSYKFNKRFHWYVLISLNTWFKSIQEKDVVCRSMY